MSAIVSSAEKPWATMASEWVLQALSEALGQRARASLILSGGGTPLPVYRELRGAPGIEWQRVDLFLGDERCVPDDHEDSNGLAAEQVFVLPGREDNPTLHRPIGLVDEPEQAAQAYGMLVPREPDVCLLGIGGDGHFASLFPGQRDWPDTPVFVVRDSPKPPPMRITLGVEALLASRHVGVLVKGEGKAQTIADAIAGTADVQELPAVLLKNATWLLDEGAASRLG